MAAADGKRCVRNAAYRLYFVMRTITTGQLLSGDAANLDVEVSQDDGGFADVAGAETEIGSTGVYYVDLTAAECTGSVILLLIKSSTANTDEQLILLPFEPCVESGVAQSATSTTLRFRSAASYADDYFNGMSVEIARGTGAGQVRTITDYVNSTDTATVDRAWTTTPDSTSVYIVNVAPDIAQTNAGVANCNLTHIDSNTAAVAIMKALYKGGAVSDAINDATPTTTAFDGSSALSATDDFYNGRFLLFVTGTFAGLAEEISDYDGTNKTITLTNALSSAPANGDEFVIIGKST